MDLSEAGSQVTLVFQTKYQTFTPAQFFNTFEHLGFTKTQGLVNTSPNPSAPPVQTDLLSKDNLVVVLNTSENVIMFHIINTLDLANVFKDVIRQILVKLNFTPASVGILSLNCVAQIHNAKPPVESLTSLVSQDFVDELKSPTTGGTYSVTSLRLTTRGDGIDDQMSITIEPLQTDPTGSYYLVVNYQSRQNDKFNEFVSNFGKKMLLDIAEKVEKNA